MDPDSKRVRVSVSDGSGRAVSDGGLGRWLAAVAPPRAVGDVAVALVSDARMRALNRKFRRRDRATDVLSFPAAPVLTRDAVSTSQGSRDPTPARSRSAASRLARAGGALGDIVIATGVARRQAKEAGHSYQAELRVLALHGLLHLLGYNHHDRQDQDRMASVETTLRRKGGLTAGLIERAATRPPTRRRA